jgi:uncharacterized protein (DUF697 family)
MDFSKIFNEAAHKAHDELGHVNILIAGRSGVGKSTLINAVFGENLAETGDGRPVTKHTRSYTKSGIPLTIYDTRGLEMQDYEQTVSELEEFISTNGRKTNSDDHIHVAWICISEDSRRVEDAEASLATMLAKHMPCLGVITKSRADQGFRAKVQQLLPETRNVVRVRAVKEELDEGHVLMPLGLDHLIEATYELVPEGHKRAFAAAQKASMNLKVKQAHLYVVSAATTAGAAGAVPIPFSDVAVIVPIQVGMLAGISAVFGFDVTSTFLTTLVGSAAGVTGASLAGRAIVSNILKLIPGAGSIAGSAISAATAIALTAALGEAYISALRVTLAASGDELPTAESVSAELVRQLQLNPWRTQSDDSGS